MQRSDGQVVVVTGAASGHGQAIALRLARDGAIVVAADIDPQGLQQTVALAAEAGGTVHAVTCDVSVEEDVERLFESADAYGTLSSVVANAGVIFAAPLHETTVGQWDRQMNVDVRGTFLTVRAAVRRMMENGGSIVTMSGTYALQAQAGACASAAAKAAIMGLTQGVAVEYGRFGIRCNAILPGCIETPMMVRYFERMASQSGTSIEAVRARVAAQGALNRLGRPDEVASMAAFLCSEESSFCSGSGFLVDGGQAAGVNAVVLAANASIDWSKLSQV
jgi:NAD(P)-dependent dehydrogenase (short-subunit alcohol dehydrogenase family)